VEWQLATSAFRTASLARRSGRPLFDRMGPPGREPAFLRGSRGRASAGQFGIQALPPEAEDYVDRLKRQRRQ